MTATPETTAPNREPAVLELPPHQALALLRSDLGLTEKELSGALDADRRTLERWTTGRSFPQHEARARLVQLLALRQRALDAFGEPSVAGAWMHEPSGYLRGMKPVEALRAGRVDLVTAAIEAFREGVFI